jgi:hypothetical protein
LDLIFNFWKVIQLMDEMFLAGELVESSKQVVLERMRILDKNNKESGATNTPKDRRKDGVGAAKEKKGGKGKAPQKQADQGSS